MICYSVDIGLLTLWRQRVATRHGYSNCYETSCVTPG